MKRAIAIIGAALLSSTAWALHPTYGDNPDLTGEAILDVDRDKSAEATVTVPTGYRGESAPMSGAGLSKGLWWQEYFRNF